MKNIIFKIIKFFVFFIPKNEKKIIFRSFPDFSGNSLSFYNYMIKNHPNYQCIWLTDKKYNNYLLIKSFMGIYHYVTAKHVVTTHNDYISISPSNQNYISLWHGMPLKKIGYLGKDYKWMKSISAKRISTSDLTRSLISSSFNEKANNVYVTGQPVCDNLFFDGINLDKFSIPKTVDKIICYLPTFREDFNESKIEGRKVTSENIFRIDDFNHDDFLNYLKKNNIFLFVKLHPAEEHVIDNIVLNENIYFLRSNDIGLYSLLAKVDMLITDYSSVYIDYLLTDKPISFVVPDEKEYIESRNGFTVEPYNFWAPGEKVKNIEQLYKMFDAFICGDDPYEEHRRTVKNIFHTYQDSNSCHRVFELLIKNIK